VEATPSARGFLWFTGKPLGSLVDPQSQDRRTEDGGAATSDRSDRGSEWSDRCATTQSGEFEAEDTRRIARLASRLSKFVVAGHPSDGGMTKTSEFALEGHIPS
jgi:hypothetical protein